MSKAAERRLKSLIAKRESLFGILQTLFDLSNKFNDKVCLEKFNALYRSMDRTRGELVEIVENIVQAEFDVDPDYNPNYTILSTINEMCCHIQLAADKLPFKPDSAVRSLPRLPNIELPQFSGEIREWETFHSIFKSIIHENPSLTNVDKVHYLVGRLSGPALKVCSGLAPTGENYEIIWNALLDKYEDKRSLATSYLDQIVEFKAIHGETSKNLNLFLEKFDSAVRALKNLEINDMSDFIIVYLALSKLDPETIKSFEMSRRTSDLPTYEELVKFIKDQSKILLSNRNLANNKTSRMDTSKLRASKSFVVSQGNKNFRTDANYKDNNSQFNSKTCIFCHKGWHYLNQCEKFKRLTPIKRYETVRDNNWCYNCLSESHGVRACTWDRTCSECGKKHHTLLHTGRSNFERHSAPSGTQSTSQIEGSISNVQNAEVAEAAATLCSTTVDVVPNGGSVLLSTAVVNVLNSPVEGATIRILLDSGSQVNLITTRCCKKLGINVSTFSASVQGLGSNSRSTRGVADLIMGARHDPSIKYSVKSLVVDKISGKLPSIQVDVNKFPHLAKIQLADDKYYQPGEIEGIIGAELFPILLGADRVLGSPGAPIAIQTAFGFVVMGKAPVMSSSVPQIFLTISDTIEQLISKFWEIEEVPKKILPNPETVKCEQIFVDTYSRDVSGRFTVALPFKRFPENLGDSKILALTRFLSLEKRLIKFPQLRLEYNRVMQDFIDQGHMRFLSEENSDTFGYYIPHHAVFKPDSVSTPVRVVLDASAPSDSGVSLNDLLFGGPKLQTNINTLLINFRLFRFALTADIKQMYRQINIIKDHWKFQRLLWRFDINEKINVLELTKLAFGVKSSPYLALRSVKQLLSEEKHKYPLAAAVIERDLYMDDLVSSVSSFDEACELYKQSVDLFASGQFELTKWATNSIKLLGQIPIEKRLSKMVVFETDTKILGMQWNPETDVLSFKLSIPDSLCTKRIMLSAIARCFDPIGLIAPFILYLKLLVKELWRLKIDWDDKPSLKISRIWSKVVSEWAELENFQIPRHVAAVKNSPSMLLGFADACSDGYGGVVYLRTLSENGVISLCLVYAKSKVSPFKTITIPRMELCAALLLSNLLRHVSEVYRERIVISKIWAFSDSTTVIQWLNAVQINDIFVANRVSKIKENLPDGIWRHIEGTSNPADCLSRGLLPSQLINHELWIHGPVWARLSEEHWPILGDTGQNILDLESPLGETSLVATTDENISHPLLNLIERRSSWPFILRITVWVLRFLKIIPLAVHITADDVSKAETTLIKLVQKRHFEADIQRLISGKEVSLKIRKLRPFLQDGLLRVGGRLTNAQIGFAQQHPILLPKYDILVERLIDFFHQTNLHTGPHLLEAIIRQKFWILGARGVIRTRVHLCNHCFRSRPKSFNPIMADLPAYRVQQTKVFAHTGVDYFGPVNVTLGRRRGAPVHKAYICLFVCMSVKAVHLELVSSLSTSHFLQAFKRFLSRRGPCYVLYSDRGTNFIGAKRLLSDLYTLINSKEYQETLQAELVVQGIQWKLNPPSAPHMGGLWESNVKSAKSHLFRVLGDQLLTYEEFYTLLTQVEVLLNSRPLCQLSADPSAPSALTPSHFLTLSPLKGLPAEDVTLLPITRLDRFQLIDQMVQSFWKRWHLEYLSTLQIRQKWNAVSPNVTVGTVVVLKTDNSPPLHWPLAVITEVHPGKDGTVRVVTVKTSKGILIRPVVKVCPLPIQ